MVDSRFFPLEFLRATLGAEKCSNNNKEKPIDVKSADIVDQYSGKWVDWNSDHSRIVAHNDCNYLSELDATWHGRDGNCGAMLRRGIWLKTV